MQRDQLATLLRAAARVVDGSELVVIGTQALHALGPAVPPELVAGSEADIFCREQPERGDELDAALGEGSMYEDEHFTCLRAVGPMTPVAPVGWLDRLVPFVDGGETLGCCMDVHDLVLAKLVVGRGKDLDFAIAAIEAQLADEDALLARVELLPISDLDGDGIRHQLERVSARGGA